MSSTKSSRSSQSRKARHQLDSHGLHVEGCQVKWNDHNKEHPRNWDPWPKSYNNIFIFLFEFLTTLISTSGTSAAVGSHTEFDISQLLGYFVFVSVSLIGQTFGTISCSPLSEIFGRRTLYIASTFVFASFSAIIAAIPSIVAVIIGRFVTGFITAIPATVAFGNFIDVHDMEARIWAVYFFNVCGNAGLALGPIYASFVVKELGWRWIFYISTIVSSILFIASFGIKESRAAVILKNKTQEIRKSTGDEHLETEMDKTQKKKTLHGLLQDNLLRPLRFFFTEPIIFVCATLLAIAFALLYALTESLTIVYESFGWSKTNTSLAFIPILLGVLLNIIPRFYDQWNLRKCYQRQKKSNKTSELKPEEKIASFIISAPALAIGLWIFAWTIPPLVPNVHWTVSMVGLVLIGYSLNDFDCVLFGYVTDCYGDYAASAVSSIAVARNLLAAGFPLFTTQMYEVLGANVAITVLAGVATIFAFTPILLLGYAATLRKWSHFACGDGENDKDEDPLRNEERIIGSQDQDARESD